MEADEAQHTVLIVEDEVIIRMSSAATLQDAGFDVLEAGSSAEALQVLLEHQKIGILVTDVRMPGDMDGLDLVTLVRQFHPAIRSLVVSGNTSNKEARAAGAVGFLPKPYMAHSLARAVRKLVQGGAAPLGHAI